MVESNENLGTQAWAHSFAAQAAVSADEPEIAEQQYAEAVRLFALAPKTEAIRGFILWHEIHMAGIEAHVGRFDAGIARLVGIQGQVRQSSDTSLEGTFYATLADIELRSHRAVQAEEAFRPALESVEQRLSSLNSEKDRITWSREAAPVYLGMAEAELVQGHAEAALGYFEMYLGAPDRSGERNQNGLPVHNATPDPAWLTSRSPLLTGRTIWTYDNRGLNAQWIPQSNQELQALAARFYALASDPRSELMALRRDSQKLYRALIAPVEQRLDPGRTVVIEADGWLAQVPFEALLDSNGHYLIERAPIVRSLGQSMDASLREDVPISKNLHALIVGSAASSQTEGLVPLPDVSAEAAAVARDFRSPDILKGSDVTLAAVENDLRAAAVFHFTGHSLSRANGGGLMLTVTNAQKKEPVLLGADKLRRLDLRNMQLAVLSTCNTESGRDGAGDFNSIAEALQRAGVPHVVASRWAVDSVETQRFVEDFYTSALSGKAVSEAMREASRKMMADSRTSHPYYWSAFSAYGRP
jgi:CHAT domain-containing protein